MQDCSILDFQGIETATSWVRNRHKNDILTCWTLNDCHYFLLLSPTTQKKLGGCDTSISDTEGSLRLMTIQRTTMLLALRGIDIGPMPYQTPRGLGQIYGSYETIRRVLLADFCNRVTTNSGSNNSDRVVDTSAAAINHAVQEAMYHLHD